jgi:hypothetical protein
MKVFFFVLILMALMTPQILGQGYQLPNGG